MTKGSAGKKAAPRKRGGAYPYKPVSFIVNGVKYKPGQKPARVCPAPAVDPHPLSPFERHLAESLHAAAEHNQQLRDQDAKMRKGGKPGRVSDKVKQLHVYIRELLTEWPSWPRPRLYEKADKTKIGDLTKERFDVHVRTVVDEATAGK